MPKARKVQLSKHLLELKFMKRSKLRVEKERESEEGQQMFEKHISKEMIDALDHYIIEPSYAKIHDLVVGRLSYNGKNPEIEKLMDSSMKNEEQIQPDEIDKDVTDEDMAKHFTLIDTIAKRFNRHHKNKIHVPVRTKNE